MTGYTIVGLVGASTTFLATFFVRWFAPRVGAVAMPGPRSMHTNPTPTLGGAAMFLGLLAAFIAASQMEQFHAMFDGSSEPLGVVIAAGVMFAVGMLDDVRDVSPPAKVAGQVLSGSVLSLLGVTMLFFRVPFASYDYVVLSPNLAALVTVVAVVLLANAVNLIDGLDGLAAGIVIIAATAFFLYSDRLFKAGLLDATNIAPLVAVMTVSICAGFLPHNFNPRRAQPARIIMGDTGAMLLGLLLAVMAITVGGRTADQFSGQTYFFFAPLLIPILILAVPLIDTAFAFVRRLARRQSFSTADHEHIHHRLMRLGHGPRRTVMILWLWAALVSAAALIPTYANRGNALVPLALAALLLLLFTYFQPGFRMRLDAEAEAREVQRRGPPEAGDAPDEGVVDLEERRRARSG
jgi:UDP-GlcNAc:undecaprenyl-phosphate/decaprenyl-phosphate GlcNAc-1-phosphate transferase